MELRDAVEQAVAELDAVHHPLILQPGKEPVGCELCYPGESGWPCVSKMVADDLRRALDGQATA